MNPFNPDNAKPNTANELCLVCGKVAQSNYTLLTDDQVNFLSELPTLIALRVSSSRVVCQECSCKMFDKSYQNAELSGQFRWVQSMPQKLIAAKTVRNVATSFSGPQAVTFPPPADELPGPSRSQLPSFEMLRSPQQLVHDDGYPEESTWRSHNGASVPTATYTSANYPYAEEQPTDLRAHRVLSDQEERFERLEQPQELQHEQRFEQHDQEHRFEQGQEQQFEPQNPEKGVEYPEESRPEAGTGAAAPVHTPEVPRDPEDDGEVPRPAWYVGSPNVYLPPLGAGSGSMPDIGVASGPNDGRNTGYLAYAIGGVVASQPPTQPRPEASPRQAMSGLMLIPPAGAVHAQLPSILYMKPSGQLGLRFECKRCNVMCTSFQGYKSHCINNHDRVMCLMCQGTYSLFSFEEHVQNCCGQSSYCFSCNQWFITETFLGQHMLSAHGSAKARPAKKLALPAIVNCSICRRSYTRSYLSRHMKNHHR